MPIPFPFNFKNPDYREVMLWRGERLERIRKDPAKIGVLKRFYKDNPAQFIIDWGMTEDPRNPERGLPTRIPFILFPAQEEWIHWLLKCWKEQKPGVSDKSRDMGLSWLTTALATTLCLHNKGLEIGFLSRKEEYVDSIGDPKSLLEKVRIFVSLLPKEFRGDWDRRKDSVHKKISFPQTGSRIRGEAGDGSFRGDRLSLIFVDEAAWIPRAHLLDASLSATGNCRIDISTPHGRGNPFADKRFDGKTEVFSLHWTKDPRKDQEWYEKKCNDINDPIVIAQEIDLNYDASQEGIVIPSAWVQASIDAHIKLNLSVSGIRRIGFDIADEGKDLNAIVLRHGFLVEHTDIWSGKGIDIYKTTQKTFNICDQFNCDSVKFDEDGLGAGVRGDANKINSERNNKVHFEGFRGSGEISNKNGDAFDQFSDRTLRPSDKFRTNEDYFSNLKAQAWWQLRTRFHETYRAVVEGLPFDENKIISISSSCPNYLKLISELSQPTYSQNSNGKILIDKKPDGSKSPNIADALMMCFFVDKQRKGFYSV